VNRIANGILVESRDVICDRHHDQKTSRKSRLYQHNRTISTVMSPFATFSVEQALMEVDGQTLTLKYEVRREENRGADYGRDLCTEKSDLKPGVKIFIPAATEQTRRSSRLPTVQDHTGTPLQDCGHAHAGLREAGSAEREMADHERKWPRPGRQREARPVHYGHPRRLMSDPSFTTQIDTRLSRIPSARHRQGDRLMRRGTLTLIRRCSCHAI
jgi:hypothetical protein